MSYTIHIEEFPNLVFEKKFSKGFFDEIKINENITLSKSDLSFEKDIFINSNNIEDKEGIISISIPLSNTFHYSYQSYDNNINYSMKKDYTDIIFLRKLAGQSNIKRNRKLKSVQIQIKKRFFETYFSDLYLEKLNSILLKDKDILHLSSYKTNIKSKLCANELFLLEPYNFDLLQIQSKVFEILSYELPFIFNIKTFDNKKIKFSDYDVHALYKAKEILVSNYKNPPSISELAKIIKLNEFKLKYGYKIIFKTTPYKTILDIRMAKGKELLENSELNIQEISNEVGYKQACSFTKAFIETYKIKPRDLIKIRKYYY